MARYISEEPGFQSFVDAADRMPVLSRDEELELARRWRDRGDARAKEALVASHLRSVIKMAHKYRGYGIYLSDLVAEGNLGLLEAVDRFEPERGLRFLTYARHWVRAYMLAHVLKHWSIVDMGTTALQSKLFFRLQAEHARLRGELGEDDDAIRARLAAKFQISEDEVTSSLARLSRRDASLDAPVLDEGGATFLDLLAESGTDQETRAADAEVAALVRGAIDEVWPVLDVRERTIVRERLLPASGEPATLATLGRRLGVTRERVRQLEAGIKRRLRMVLDRALVGDQTEVALDRAA